MTTARLLAATLTAGLLLAACGSGGGGDDDGTQPGDDAGVPFTDCADSDQAFVRNAYLALLGRRPHSQAEVQVYADIMASTRALAEADSAGADAGAAAAPADPREVVARALLERPDFADHWAENVMDALRIPRIEDQSQASCYGDAARSDDQGITDGTLAGFLRDNGPRAGSDGKGRFTMTDVLRSSLYLDDLSVVYRAHLFALVSRGIPAANVPRVEAELARREDFGNVFDSAYLNRDMVCLGCHNSESSVTDSSDPALDRHFPLPGHLEAALYGVSNGIDPAQAHAVFRFDGFSAGPGGGSGGTRPWGWDAECGEFFPDNVSSDPADVDGKFGALTGKRLTAYDLERSLDRGVKSLAASGLTIAADGSIADPDQAFAYLVAMSVVESTWREVMGTPLTIANYFPRNQAASDILKQLTDEFVKNHFSLKELLVDIVTTDYFNRKPPEAGCGTGPYNMPNIYDPWVTSDADEAKRQNGPGDAVVPLSARTLLRAGFEALEWPRPAYWAFPTGAGIGNFCVEFYSCDEMNQLCQSQGNCCNSYQQFCTAQSGLAPEELLSFQKGVGAFLKNGERGFRGLDFQARLVYEDVFGTCRNLGDGADYIDRLVGQVSAGVTVGDVVAALKDRLVGQARVSHDGSPSEKDAVEAIIGASLDAPASAVTDLDGRVRALCGVLMSSPQALLSGMAAPDSAYVPVLTLDEDSYDATCTDVAGTGLSDDLILSCTADGLTVSH